MIKVLYMVSSLRTGGSLTLVGERVRALQDNQQTLPAVCALLPTRAGTAQGKHHLEGFESLDVEVIGHSSRWKSIGTLVALIRAMRKVDIIHSVNAPISYVAMASILARRPLVRDMISTEIPSTPHQCAARIAVINLAISHAVADVHRAPRTKVIYPPIPVDIVSPSGNGTPHVTGAPIVLVVGRLAPGKGVRFLPAIVEELVRRFPGARMIIAGDGPERRWLETSLTKRGLSDCVSLLGYRSDIATLHEAADVYLSTSEQEGLVGYATIEAALLRTPIVASPIPAVSEVLRADVEALLIEPSDAPQVADAISRMFLDTDFSAQLVSAAQLRVREALNPAAAATELEDLYRSVVSP